jgi:hypothetical protein
MIGDRPLASSGSLELAKADALANETKYSKADEYRWSEVRPGEWRLMARSEGRKRFSWTQRWIATVPALDAVGGAA